MINLIQRNKSWQNNPNQINKSKIVVGKIRTNDAELVEMNQSLIDFNNFTSEKREIKKHEKIKFYFNFVKKIKNPK